MVTLQSHQGARGIVRTAARRVNDAVFAVERDAAVEGISARWSGALLRLPAIGIALFGAPYVVARPSFYWLLREDHPVEWAQFALPCAATRPRRDRVT